MKLCKLGIAAFALSSAGAIAATNPMSADSQPASNPGYASSQSQLHAETDSAQVSQIQQMLNDKGYQVGSVDGQMGTKTKSALKKFQQSQGLQASGRIDAQTLAALGTTPAASPTSPQQDTSQQGTSGFSPQGSDTTPPAAPAQGMSGTNGKTPG